MKRVIACVSVAAMPAVAWWLGAAVWADVAGWGTGGSRGAGTWWSSPADPDAVTEAVGLVAAGAGAVAASYLSLTALVTLVCHLAGVPREVGPRAWRTIVATAVGTGLAAGLALPATAAPSPGWAPDAPAAPTASATPTTVAEPAASHAVTVPSVTFTSAVDGGAAPVAHVVEPAAVAPSVPPSLAAASPQPEPAVPSAYVVQRGDSLWLITAALLGPEASNADIAAAWPTLYEANHDVIGANPDLIQPGTALTIPAELLS